MLLEVIKVVSTLCNILVSHSSVAEDSDFLGVVLCCWVSFSWCVSGLQYLHLQGQAVQKE